MRQRILSVIGVLWGSAIIVYSLHGASGVVDTSYGAGSLAALGAGIALLLASSWNLYKRARR